MRIGVDARAAAEEAGGRSRVLRELLTAWSAARPDHEFVLYARSRWEGADALGDRFRWVLRDLPDPAWHGWAALAASRACDVFLSTNSYLTAWLLRIPSVVVVYDLITYHPEFRPQRRARWIELATLPFAVRRAKVLACISQATADDLVARFPRAAPKARVFTLAADERFAPGEAGPAADPYVLGVGTLEPRKNLPRLIEAFTGLPDEVRAGRRLLLVGASGWETAETEAAMAAHPDVVHGLGRIPDEELADLYRGADLFAYPSLYEGFGLPVLEAMRAGTCVLTSDRSSLPEVAGDAAILVTPTDVGSIRDGLARALTDDALRARLAAAGAERAAAYSWERGAAEVLAMLEEAAR